MSDLELQVCWWSIDRVIPYARNARTIPDLAVDKVAASIKEFGWRQPIVVDREGVIIVGHVRLLAAKKLSLSQVPVHVADNLTPSQVKAYRLMDNRSHQETDWDLELLGPEISELKDLAVDLSLTGFDAAEIDRLLASGEDDEKANAAPPLPEVAVTRLGDLWHCAAHRVLCGDATEQSAISRLCAAHVPFLMVTDPPYGVEYDPEWREEAALNPRTVQAGKVSNDDQVDWSPAWALFQGDVAYVWHAGIFAGEVAASLFGSKFQIRGQIIWRKQHFAISRGAYHWQHEPCWYAVRKGKSAHWRGDRTQSTVWDVANLNPMGGNHEETKTGHGTQKPVELMRRPILNHTERGDVVYDPFLGSGTTMIACEMTERICYGQDIDPRYVDVIVKRWQDFTGQQATLDGDGRTFNEISTERFGAQSDVEDETQPMEVN
jgi:DNA modification methylase